jgi:hypothetical protein
MCSCGIRPFIEDVDDGLPDLIRRVFLCQTYPIDKGTFFASSLFGVGGNDRSCLSTDVFRFG